MNNFELLHPALQHQIVNALGWRELRPFQEEVIPRIIDGENLIVLAPTAGGKTEAAFFPVLSQMLTEGWEGLSVLYICPIKALLNNLETRLERYCELVGRQAGVWHGDVNQSKRKKLLKAKPDCLLTTPESLEVMLVSPSINQQDMFSNLRVVIVDEVHAFAGDDRGWHLLAVLERISIIAGREIQRLGLSATVGNPDLLSEWLSGQCTGKRGVYAPSTTTTGEADVELDFVGSLQNAAVVISRLHSGEKRLVFVDSRARSEELSNELRNLGVTTFVTHSSLSQEQRRQAEDAFASRQNCVIVATSVLELGIDVGDLDRVIQIDAPYTVASFLQRMGRTGRRDDVLRNCLFLATTGEMLLQSAGILDLWETGFIEPIIPPARPYHIQAQQLMALVLQEGGLGLSAWHDWLDPFTRSCQLPAHKVQELIQFMIETGILWNDTGVLWLGQEGESTFGRQNFLELFSVFVTPPEFTIMLGRQEIGRVDEASFLGKRKGPRVLLLGGRSWVVNHVDWQRRVAHVELTEHRGKARWAGGSMPLSFPLVQAMKRILADNEDRTSWSQRAPSRMDSLRQDYVWLDSHASDTVLLGGIDGQQTWWTFAGIKVNAALANELTLQLNVQVEFTGFSVEFPTGCENDRINDAIATTRASTPGDMLPTIDEAAIEGFKFTECVPKKASSRNAATSHV